MIYYLLGRTIVKDRILKFPKKIYKLIVISALAAMFPLAGICEEEFSSAIPDSTDSAVETNVEQETAEETDANIKYIKDIEIHGVSAISESEVLSKLNLHNGDKYNNENIREGLKNIYETGYFTEKMRAIPVTNPDGTITLKIILEENAPIADFTLEGNTVVSTEELLEPLLPLKGKPQNIEQLQEAIAKIKSIYASKGYILARVDSITDDPDGTVNISIKEGIVNSIAIAGNNKTKDYVVARNILVEPGSVYNENLVKQDLVRLYATQSYKNVTREIEPCEDDPDMYDITINIEEQKSPTTLSIGAGLDSVTGVFGNAGIANNNFRGLNQRISLNGIVGSGTILNDSSIMRRINMQFELSFFEPHFLNADTSLMSKIYYRDFGSYQVPLAIERRLGGEITVAHKMKHNKHLTSTLSLGVENVDVKEGDFNKIKGMYAKYNIPISRRAEELDGGLFLSLSPALVYDTRDSNIVTRKGTLANIRFDESFALNGFSKTHGKLTGSIKQYIPIGKKSSFSLMARAGGRIHGDMPEVMAFRLGGPYSVRGYKMSGVGTGNAFIMGSAEFATPIPFIDRTKLSRGKMGNFLNNIRLTAFVDAGKVFDKTIASTLYDRPMYGVSAGVGIKLYVPGMGPISIDYGIPFTHVGSNGAKHGYFTFGAGDLIY
jgi:outer membrane protein insertion porin family